MQQAVFLDRDDTLIDNQYVTAGTAHPGDLLDPGLVRLLPGVGASLARLRDAGYLLIVVTNQAGVAEGLCQPERIEEVNDRFRALLEAAGVRVDGLYYSPFIKSGSVARFTADHDWRKPRPGMVVVAAREFGVDVSRSWMVGDAARDVESGVGAGIPADRCLRIGAGASFADVPAAVEHILRVPGRR
jgi:D-glycero-D-manno-heptose 1,7-bisphosphate phosphatase